LFLQSKIEFEYNPGVEKELLKVNKIKVVFGVIYELKR